MMAEQSIKPVGLAPRSVTMFFQIVVRFRIPPGTPALPCQGAVRLSGMIVAPQYGARQTPKNRASKSVPVLFTIAAYRRSSRFPAVPGIKMDIRREHFFYSCFFLENTG